MKEKIFKFFVGTKFGLLLMINFFFVVGLFAATDYFLGGFIWFASNALIMLFAYNTKVTVSGGTGGGTVSTPEFPTNPNDEIIEQKD